MATSAEQMRAWQGPALLSYGYRPFFLFAGIWAVISLTAWIFLFSGKGVLAIAIDPFSWHAHSFLFGYLWAVIAGFLMTAVPNWTGRLPMIGWPLLVLLVLWMIGRIAMAISTFLPSFLTIALDLVFPLLFTLAIGREIISGKNWRNLKVLVLLALLLFANILFDVEAFSGGYAADGYGARLALAVAVFLIALIGGRIVPSFTRNWLAKQGATKLPAPHDKNDQTIMVLTALCLVLWVIFPDSQWTAVFCAFCGFANLYRLFRWRGLQTLKEPLVWVLHVGFLFIPLGFIALALGTFDIIPGGRAPVQHLWMAGGIGMMTIAVMTRASLGHAGRPLTVSWPVVLVYCALFFSVWLRLIAGIANNNLPLLHLSGTLWMLAFIGFVGLYWNVLTKPRKPRVLN
ncbi:NnrS family protein [uncultured Bartonella sp.]|uniref:NnrS family protein n=1 Tax=uncultured Bartonella sp. TaxID=104108 RepID=UPI0025DBF44F|nr:NnrS family protein [uncultured Bartonella sp.]